jgi:hypothetical protein
MIKYVYCTICSKQLDANKYKGIPVIKIKCKDCSKKK